ncbi:MAG: hypothetical protein EBS23_07020 [Betaproteobacteria bacterium]|nr:hypothetical protein [Betaproteobacteria bacterium]
MALITIFLCGLLFGIGLIVSGMADPANVIAFLDLGGLWNPQLALVMGGAVGVGLAGFALARRRARPLLASGRMQWPTATAIDRKLIAGSVLFGIGWGLAGFCPGPALVGVGLGSGEAVLFTVAMLAGMYLHRKLGDRL